VRPGFGAPELGRSPTRGGDTAAKAIRASLPEAASS